MRAKFTFLSDSQWQYIEKIIGKRRKSKHSLRDIVEAILYLNYTGVQWRNLTYRDIAWQTVYYHFRQFKRRGIWEQILDSLVVEIRIKQGKEASPSLLAIDSQRVKSVQFVSQEVGVDGNKKIKGRKRIFIVDKLGLPFAIKVVAANISDSQAGIAALEQLSGKVPRLQKIAADSGYKGTFITHVEQVYGWEVEIAAKPAGQKGFIPEKNRWQVERAFSFLNFRRRLFREVEKMVESAEAMLQIAFISFIINYL
ncbi:MAG: IS5 family transposase [Bacteroidia bacterium]|nr:IS5 family transposase [Bacteroidia bacterium]